MSLSSWPGKVTFGIICLLVLVGIVVAGWMGKYPPDRISEPERWLLATVGALLIIGGCGLIILLFPPG